MLTNDNHSSFVADVHVSISDTANLCLFYVFKMQITGPELVSDSSETTGLSFTYKYTL